MIRLVRIRTSRRNGAPEICGLCGAFIDWNPSDRGRKWCLFHFFSIKKSNISVSGTSVAPVDTECKSPGGFTKSWNDYVKEGDNITLIVCSEEEEKYCHFNRGEDNYCFKYTDNTTK